VHHAFAGTGAIALAAALPGSIVAHAMGSVPAGSGPRQIRFGHASGRLAVGTMVRQTAGGWRMEPTILSRSARVIMSGWVHYPS
jgi:2-methylaconitate cis-trans-isomerase PrpF